MLLICSLFVVSLLTKSLQRVKIIIVNKGSEKMKTLTSAINVQVNKDDKEQATMILNDLGLNMSTAINMFLKQIIKSDGLPFEVTNKKPSKELLKALKEGEDILSGKKKAKGYTNMNDLIKDLNS